MDKWAESNKVKVKYYIFLRCQIICEVIHPSTYPFPNQ